MKTNTATSYLPNKTSSSVDGTSSLPCKLKEIQGSFALEGINISDERMLKYAAEFAEAEKSGEINAEIERAIKGIR